MRAVQRRLTPGWRAVGAATLTVLAGLLVLLVLTAPHRLADVRPAAFLRLPLELLVLLAVVLALPPRLGRVRTAVAVASGLVLALTAVFKLLDMGFLAGARPALRPADRLALRRLAGRDRPRLVRGTGSGSLLLVGAALTGRRAAGPGAARGAAAHRCVDPRHRAGAARAVAGLAALWLVAGAARASAADAGPIAARDAAAYVYGQVTRIPGELADMREFAEAAETDPLRDVPAEELLTGLRGKDVLFVFVESYGRVAIEDSGVSPRGRRGPRPRRTGSCGRPASRSRSAFLTSPTFGALSWLAHATLQSGLWVDSQQRYDALVTSPRLTLSQPVRARRVAHGRVGARPTPGLAAGRVLRLRPGLRLAQRRVRGSAVRLPDDARPVHPGRVPPARARARAPAAGDGGDRPDHQPRPVVADPAADRAGRGRRRIGLRRDARAAAVGDRHLALAGAGASGRTATPSSTR